MASLAEGLSTSGEPEVDDFTSDEDGDDGVGDNRDRVDETESSDMFSLDGRPDIPDAEKLRYLVESMGEVGPGEHTHGSTWKGSAKVRHGGAVEHYIVISRGEVFADSFDTWFLAKTFPSLFPLGKGGPREAEEHSKDAAGPVHPTFELEAAEQHLVSSRNMGLEACVKMVIQRHGGRFATHPVFSVLVFNIGVRSRNRRVSMASMRRSDFPDVEHTIQDLTASRLEKARGELEACGVQEGSTRDIESPQLGNLPPSGDLHVLPVLRDGWEGFVLGRVSQYYGAVETNERGALHLHGLLWLQGNMYLSSLLSDVQGEEQAAYRQRVTENVDSVFTEDLDEESFARVRAGKLVTSDVSSLLERAFQFPPNFEEEANFCAGATQIHTHSPTCVKYAIGRRGTKQNPRRYGAPWKPVEKAYFNEDGLLRLRRSHSLVNRWNKVMAVGLRHNHEISFNVTKCKGLALVYYVTNYATKVGDPVWKRVVAAKEVIRLLGDDGTGDQSRNGRGRTEGDNRHSQARQFLLRMANRIFTERALSQVEVLAHFQGYETELTNSTAWTFLNVCTLYWHIFRRWPLLHRAAGGGGLDESIGETVLLGRAGQRISLLQAYPYRSQRLEGLALYDYMSVVKLKRKGGCVRSGEVELDRAWPLSASWIQTPRHPNQLAAVCLDGYLGMDFTEEGDSYYRRYVHPDRQTAMVRLFEPSVCSKLV
ncbi:uncharacterized protein FMAN_15546 [Fusarium mangiferae]|uniref:Helitron helicase-like domain-containing protein n=1 Tax=Fusarium mangiferae TaxID=192010 RepID=A0A1L7ULR2_FUSMA|nr:uncharacterized protein FMAN_15546 [Fusarium mangiferae]CVL09413.1 uncharacterized protein FMAN_15546 [Fusarium mangiferae]